MNILQDMFQKTIPPIICTQCDQSPTISPELIHNGKLQCHCGNTLAVMTEQSYAIWKEAVTAANDRGNRFEADLKSSALSLFA